MPKRSVEIFLAHRLGAPKENEGANTQGRPKGSAMPSVATVAVAVSMAVMIVALAVVGGFESQNLQKMRLKKLSILNFKNITEGEVVPCEGLPCGFCGCLWGDAHQGSQNTPLFQCALLGGRGNAAVGLPRGGGSAHCGYGCGATGTHLFCASAGGVER